MSAAATLFYLAGGTLPRDAPSYVVQQADTDLYQSLSRGEFCYVLTSRQMGKSSLMVRTAARLHQEGVACVPLDLTAIGRNLSAEQWYGGLLASLGKHLGLVDELDDFWRAHLHLSPLQRWMEALREVVLEKAVGCRLSAVSESGGPSSTDRRQPTADSPKIVIFIDEIDVVRVLPFDTDEFFAAIRECYNRRTQDPEFARLTFCLLGVASPSGLIRDTRLTPFNIGRRIELTDFTAAEAAPLAAGLLTSPPAPGVRLTQPTAPRGAGEAAALFHRILYWTGGHPYLTQRLCRAVAEEGSVTDATGVDRPCAELFLSSRARERDDNLLFVRERMLRSDADQASLLDLYARVRRGKRVPDDEMNPLVSALHLSGIARAVEGSLQVRNRIYARVFDREWVTANMPDAELRRQQAAYRRGLLRATSVAAGVLAVVGALALTAINQSRRADRVARQETRQRRLAQKGQQTLRRHLYSAQMSVAQQIWETGAVAGTLELLDRWRPEPGQEDPRGFEWRLLWRLAQGDARAVFEEHSGPVFAVAFSPDGTLLASAGADATVRLWRAPTFRETDPLEVERSLGGDRTVTLQWRPLPWAAGYNVFRGPVTTSDARWLKLNASPVKENAYTDRGADLTNGRPRTYGVAPLYRSASGTLVEGPRVRLQAAPVAAPPGWTGCSLLEGLLCGSALFEPLSGEIRLRGAGEDIPYGYRMSRHQSNEADGFYFLNRPMTGAFEVTVQALTLPGPVPQSGGRERRDVAPPRDWAQTGLMIREALDAGARHAFLHVAREHGLVLKWRPTADDYSSTEEVIPHARLKLPISLRLTRHGDTITATTSTDGGRSFRPASAPLRFVPPLPATVHVGLAITSCDPRQLAEARFKGLEVRPGRARGVSR